MKEVQIRMPAVSGSFYPSSAVELKEQISLFIDKKAHKVGAIACMLPHAGYIYSGRVAAETISYVHIKERIILLGPNHTGVGSKFSIMSQGIWQTPLGNIEIDEELASRILRHTEYMEDDRFAHLYEHSLEVELPILQYINCNFKIIPIVISSNEVETLKRVGISIAAAITEAGLKDSVLIVASSDMSHYEPLVSAKKKDAVAIDSILALDEDKLMKKVAELNISMCGYAPVTVMLTAAKLLGAKTAKLIKYQTSADVTKDKNSVVGYAGIVIY